MIPEAFQEAHDFAGLITAIGFLCAFALTNPLFNYGWCARIATLDAVVHMLVEGCP